LALLNVKDSVEIHDTTEAREVVTGIDTTGAMKIVMIVVADVATSKLMTGLSDMIDTTVPMTALVKMTDTPPAPVAASPVGQVAAETNTTMMHVAKSTP